jgi:hypothetical protein
MEYRPWNITNAIVRNILTDDRADQLRRLETECTATTDWYTEATKARFTPEEHGKAPYLTHNGHRIDEITTLIKLRAKASDLRSDWRLRHRKPTPPAECRLCGHPEETAEHVLNHCPGTLR